MKEFVYHFKGVLAGIAPQKSPQIADGGLESLHNLVPTGTDYVGYTEFTDLNDAASWGTTVDSAADVWVDYADDDFIDDDDVFVDH